MNDMASIRKMRPLESARANCVSGGLVRGELDSTSAVDVDCFFGGNAQVYQGVWLPFFAFGESKQGRSLRSKSAHQNAWP